MFTDAKEGWSDGLRCGGRTPHLFVVAPDGAVHVFAGESIPGVVAIVGSNYDKNGKWSSTTYRFRFATGALAVDVCVPMHARSCEEFGDWAEAHAEFERVAERGVDRVSFEAAMRKRCPKGSALIDEREAAIAALLTTH